MHATHRNCGGEVKLDWSTMYEYEHDDGRIEDVPAYFCQKCGKEILGDREIDTFFDLK